MSLKQTFKKQGGFKLIRQYLKGGALGTAICEFILLGKSRTALEILRLAAQLKTKQKLNKKYGYLLNKFDANYDNSISHHSSNKVWVCWFQGMENAPDIVKKCYSSLKKNLSNKEIIVITKDNFKKYVQFPQYIYDKWEKGIITNTHMTDLLRLELLIKYGGTWIDATVLCTQKEENIPKYFLESDLFFYQSLKPGRDGQSTYVSSWYMSAKSNNRILRATRMLCYEYWKDNKSLVDYYLLHDFLSIVLEHYPDIWHQIIPRDNSTPHELLLRLFDKYDPYVWKSIVSQSPFHKLTYKYQSKDIKRENCFLNYILKDNDIKNEEKN